MAYNTGNAIGSTDARDLYDNAMNLDKAMNSSAATWTDRFGVSRPTFKGAESELNEKVAAAAASAEEAAAIADSIDDRYLGSKAADPATDNDGNPLQIGAEYYNTATGYKRTYGISGWYTPNVDGQALGQSGPGQGADMVGYSEGLWYADGTVGKSIQDRVLTADLASTAAGKGAELVGYGQAGTGAVASNVQTKLREFAVSVKDYGAVGDGVTDDRAAINLAFAEVIGRGAGTVYFPAGTYRCTGDIGNVSAATNRVSIAVLGEAGAVINFDPAVAANVGLNLRFAELNIGIVKNLDIRCNNKVATGVRVYGDQVSPTSPTDLIYIDKVRVSGCNVVNNPSITTAAAGISTQSKLGVTCWITNCYVVDVSRDKLSFSSGIEAAGFITTFIANNAIFNVTHNNITPLYDADGVKVFSFNDGADHYYRQSTATVINNHVVNCDGRFIKLQTNGNAVVENNVLSLTADMQLINSFQFIDSQVVSATISHNKIQALSNWTGGDSSTVFSIQFADPANFLETNESFVQRVENNDVYITKRFAYGVMAQVIDASQCNMFYYIKQNTISSDIPLELTGNVGDAAVGRFVYLAGGATLAGFTGKLFLDISDNRVSSATGLLSVANTSNDDFADKWFWYIYDNFIYTWSGGDVVVTSGGGSPLNNCAYTSTLMVRDNNVGSSGATRNRLRLPLNISKILSGSDFETGDGAAPTMTNVPANWRSGRIYKKGLVSGVETIASGPTAVHYLSTDNGAHWYQV